MKKILLSMLLAVSFVGVVHADDVTQVRTNVNLSDAQKAELAATAAKMAQDNANNVVAGVPSAGKVEVVKQWVDIGTAIGSGLAASAKELGIAANEFAQTPVGRFTVFLIAWHFIGNTLLHVFFALLWFFVVGGTLFYVWRRSCLRSITSTFEKGEGPNGARKVVKKEPIPSSEDVQPIHVFLGIGSAVYVIVLSIMLCNL
jgi:hypothetical protein